MSITKNPAFQQWLERRLADDPARRTEREASTECTQCGGPLRDDDVPGDMCLTCLAVHFGAEQAEQQFAQALTALVHVALLKDSRLVGRLLGEIAEHVCAAVEYASPQPSA